MIHDNNNFSFVFRISKYIPQISIISFLFLLFLINNSNITVFGQQSSNSHIGNEDLNIVAIGDFYCNDEIEETIENIKLVNPELIITTGDRVKDQKSAKCWIEMSQDIKDKMKIAIGNHDTEFANIYKQIVDYHNIKNPYYSHDFYHIHFITIYIL